MPAKPADKPRVVVTSRVPGSGTEMLEKKFDVTVLPPSGVRTETELKSAIARADAVLGMLSDPFNRSVLEGAARLKILATFAVGFNNIDTSFCKERGIKVCNTPDVLTEATAELAFSLLLAVSRRIVEGHRMMAEGKFNGWAPDMLLGIQLTGKRCGIIGLGRIGAAFARRAKAFGMDIFYFNRHDSPHAAALGAKKLSLDELLKTSDVVSIHTPLNPESNGLLSRERLTLLKPDAILINTARGQVIDEKALVELLRERKIFGAGLDVFEKEPALAPGLMDLDNAVLAPHIGSATRETRAKMGELCAQAIIDTLEGREPKNRVA